MKYYIAQQDPFQPLVPTQDNGQGNAFGKGKGNVVPELHHIGTGILLLSVIFILLFRHRRSRLSKNENQTNS